MADKSSNTKSLRGNNQRGKEILQQENVNIEETNVKKVTDDAGNVTEETETVSVVYANGTTAFAKLFNDMAEEANRKAQKEADKPKYRFIGEWGSKEGCCESLLTQNTKEAAETINAISDLQEKIYDKGYSVQIIENLDCKNVTKESRYCIRIEHNNGVYVDIDLFEYENKIKDFSFDEQEFMSAQICKITGSVTQTVTELAGYAVEYLSYILYFKSLYTLVYRKIGWEYYDWDIKGWIFKYDKIYSRVPLLHGRGLNKYTEGLQKVNDPNGEEEIKWVLATIKLINHHPFDALIIGAGISGLVRQLLPYTKETNININIIGKPASGKSTICHYLLSIFGNPELLEGSFTDTENATEQRRVSRPVLPYVLDDRMLKLETDSEKVKQQKIVADVFREYEGKVKERFGKQYEEESGDRTYGPIISSSVRSMMEYLFQSKDLGQYRRFMEFNVGDKNSGIVFSDAQEAKRYEELAYKSYGIGIEIIIEYMFELLSDEDEEEDGKDKKAKEILRRFNDLDEYVEQALKIREKEEAEKAKENGTSSKVHGLDSSSKRFSLIILSYQIFREALIYYTFNKFQEVAFKDAQELGENVREFIEACSGGGSFEECLKNQTILKDSSEAILKLLTDNLVEKMKRLNKALTDKDLYDYIRQNEGKGAFIQTEKFTPDQLKQLVESKGEIIGFYEMKDEDTVILNTLQDFSLENFWEMFEIPSIDVIRQYCHRVLENKMDRAAAVKLGNEEYNTEKAVDKTKFVRNYKKIDGKIVYFDCRTIRIADEEGEES